MQGSRAENNAPISHAVKDNIAFIERSLEKSLDIVIREFRLGNGQEAATFFLDGFVDRDLLGRDLYLPLMNASKDCNFTIEELSREVLHVSSIVIVDDMRQLIDYVLQGLIAVMIEGAATAIVVEAINWPQRSVAEPGTDVVIRGPREGFIENMRSNVALLRKKIHHPDFQTEVIKVGRYSQTNIALVYISSIVNREVLKKIQARIKKIDIDAILDSGYIEQLIQDTPYSFFPTIGIAEKPDIAAAKILEGRVAVLVDGSPIVLTVPMLFVEGLQSGEDYYTRFFYATWVRVLRFIAIFFSILLPGIFVAAVSYHQQIIPFRLFLSIAAGEAQTPFSVGLSVLMIGLVYEILREAGVRLPKPAGQAISIVGAIVMGDAAVSAGLISAAVLIVLAITVIASFVTAPFVEAATLLRIIFLLLGWFVGLFGILIGMVFLLIYLCSLETFGIAYFSPFAPLDLQGLKDSAVRMPLWQLKWRPQVLSRNRRRMAANKRGD